MKDPRMKSAYCTIRYYAFESTHNLYKITLTRKNEKRLYKLYLVSTEEFVTQLLYESNKFSDVYDYLVSLEGYENE